jgi:HEAT repeat protein
LTGQIARIALSFGVLLWCCGLCLHGFGQTDDVLHEIANLRDPASGIRSASARNLGKMGDRRAVPALIAALNNADPRLQDSVVRALAELKDPRAIEPLIDMTGKGADAPAADIAILALGEFKDARAIATLIDLLNRSTQNDEAVASALARIGATAVPPLLAALKSPEPASRVRVLDALGWIDNAQATDALIGYMKDPDPRVRKAVVVGLKGHGDAPGMLVSPFDTAGWLRSLRQRESPVPKDPRVPGLLITALQDSDAAVQSAAVEGLGALKVGAAVDPLMMLLRKPVNEGQSAPAKTAQAVLRKNVAIALGNIGDVKAVPALIAALEDPADDVRMCSARSLGHIKDQRSTEALVSLVSDKNNSVRREALNALAQIKDPGAVGALIEAMRKQSAEIEARSRAMSTQEMAPTARRAIVMSDPVLEQAPYALNQIGEPAVAPLISAMKGTDPVFRERILVALNGSKDASAVDAILAALEDTDPEVRSAALTALAGTSDPRAAVPFMNGWKKADALARNHAIYWLCRNDAAWTARPLIEAMKEKDSGFAARCLEPGAPLKLSIDDAVIPLLTDADNDTRGIAARTLVALVPNPLFAEASASRSGARAETALQQSLKDRNMVVICNAASYYVGRGEAGSEDTLIDALNAAGEYWLAEYFLVTGNGKLEDAGRAWLKAHHRNVDTNTFGPIWGQLRTKQAA